MTLLQVINPATEALALEVPQHSTVEVEAMIDAAAAAQRHAKVLNVETKGSTELEVHFDGHLDDLSELMQHMLAEGIKVRSMKESVNSLEDIFMKVTKGQVN